MKTVRNGIERERVFEKILARTLISDKKNWVITNQDKSPFRTKGSGWV